MHEERRRVGRIVHDLACRYVYSHVVFLGNGTVFVSSIDATAHGAYNNISRKLGVGGKHRAQTGRRRDFDDEKRRVWGSGMRFSEQRAGSPRQAASFRHKAGEIRGCSDGVLGHVLLPSVFSDCNWNIEPAKRFQNVGDDLSAFCSVERADLHQSQIENGVGVVRLAGGEQVMQSHTVVEISADVSVQDNWNAGGGGNSRR